MHVVLFDDPQTHRNLLPITFTRPVAGIRFGILTIREKWERTLPADYSCLTEPYLSRKYPSRDLSEAFFVAGNLLPAPALLALIRTLPAGRCYQRNGRPALFRGSAADFRAGRFAETAPLPEAIPAVDWLYDLFLGNGDALEADFRLLTAGRISQPLSPTNTVVGESRYPDGLPKIFLEAGAKAECVVFNLNKGPVYLGPSAEVMEGSVIRAPFAACGHAEVKLGTRIYGATTLGPYCKVGGELNNVLMLGYSNKGHDGFLGDAVIGEWCNIGAGTNASNLKNDYSEIKLWNYAASRFLRTGLQFCGLIMGDHSKAGINTMFNTATVLGVGVNIHGSGFPRNFVPSFSEGGAAGFTDVPLSKFFQVAERMMARREMALTADDKAIFESIFNQSEEYR